MKRNEAPIEIQPSSALRSRATNQVESSRNLRPRAICSPSEEGRGEGGGDGNGSNTRKRAVESASPFKRKINGVAVGDQSSSKRQKGIRSALLEKTSGNIPRSGKGGAFRVLPSRKKTAGLKEDVEGVDLSSRIASYRHPLKKRKLGKKSSPVVEVKRGRPREKPEGKKVGGVHVEGIVKVERRGRPKKKPEGMNVGGAHVEGIVKVERRGRPRKKPEGMNVGGAHVEGIVKVERRGRPRKKPEGMNVGGVHVERIVKVERRGRPRKKPEGKNVGGVHVEGIVKVERRGRPRKKPERKNVGGVHVEGIVKVERRGRPRKKPEVKNAGGVHAEGIAEVKRRKLTKKPKGKNMGGVHAEGESKGLRKLKPGGRAAKKEKVRDEIKKMLLDAGWTIQLRPRNGRDYHDSVYVPPGRIGGFWSITKAYAFYVEKCPDKSNHPEFSPIPTDQLSMLKKNMVKKRTTNKKDKGSRGLKVRGAKQEQGDGYVPYKWKRTVLSWMIDSGVLRENAKVMYKEKRNVKEGVMTRDGICCDCCKEIFSVLKFQIHAGSKAKYPYKCLFDDLGMSLLQCQMNAWEKQDETQRKGLCNIDVKGDEPHDDTCPVCGDGGDLICCDSCPSTFHMQCLDLEALPGDEWHCRNCSCKYCGLISVDATSPLLSCSHCDQKYHQECVSKEHTISKSSKDHGLLFCGQSCRKVFKQLHELIGSKNELEAGFSWSLIHRSDECLSTQPLEVDCNSKVAVAFAIMDECFLPINDFRSGANLVRNVVYNCGSNIPRLNFSRFYTIVLEREDEMVAAASIRLHGTRLAEMPFIGTRVMYRRQGMCRRLFEGIESALRTLDVEELTIPAISEMIETWTGSFGFKSLESSEGQEARSINVLAFPYIGILKKPILKSV